MNLQLYRVATLFAIFPVIAFGQEMEQTQELAEEVVPLKFVANPGDWNAAESYEEGLAPQPGESVVLSANSRIVIPSGSEAVLGNISGGGDGALATVEIDGGSLECENFIFDAEKHLAVIVNSGRLSARQLLGGGNRANLVEFTVDLTKSEVRFDEKADGNLYFGAPDPEGDHPGTTVTFTIGTEAETAPIEMGDYYAQVDTVAKYVIKTTNPKLTSGDEFELIRGSNVGCEELITGEVEGQPGVGYEIYKDEMGLRLRITSTPPAPTP